MNYQIISKYKLHVDIFNTHCSSYITTKKLAEYVYKCVPTSYVHSEKYLKQVKLLINLVRNNINITKDYSTACKCLLSIRRYVELKYYHEDFLKIFEELFNFIII